jgi:hypothetical protein
VTASELAAIIAAGLVNNDVYRKCTRRGDYNLGREAQYAVDLEAVARDAHDIAHRLEELERDRNRKAR